MAGYLLRVSLCVYNITANDDLCQCSQKKKKTVLRDANSPVAERVQCAKTRLFDTITV